MTYRTTGYDDLGVRPVINAAATLTRLGGSIMAPPVVEAMRSAAGCFIDLVELQRRVGARIAELTSNEGCYVSSGAAAGMAIAIAACITERDAGLIKLLPEGVDAEVIVFGSQRNGYDQAARSTGARLVEVGSKVLDGSPFDKLRTSGTSLQVELSNAISDRTACVLYFAGAHFAAGALPLREVVEVAHQRGVRVLVDAAAQIPPMSSLWTFTRDAGADAAIFSGGKGLRGPQSSGLVLGRAELIEACIPNGPPNHSLGRPMKVGKEEMLGILAAVEWSLAQNEAAVLAGYEAMVQRWLDGLADVPGVHVERGFPSEAGQPHARAIVHLTAASRAEVVKALWEGEPRIAVGECGEDAIALNPQTVEPGEDEVILKRLLSVLASYA
jgi:L-seryl-tRNA(Ser) seleniumtransferase